ncbi:hypothetical protein Pcinc_034353, partial [Petrolisthes cinctipes]
MKDGGEGKARHWEKEDAWWRNKRKKEVMQGQAGMMEREA